FDECRNSYKGNAKIRIINDGTNTNEERLGAVNDLLLVLKKEDIDDDLLVVAGDNLFKFEIREMIEFFNEKKANILVAYREEDKEKIKKSACIEIDENSLVVNFEEKPKEPKSSWICPAIYIFTKDTVRLIKEMRIDEKKKDLIGNIPMILYSKIDFYAFKKEKKLRFDLGTINDFDDANEYFAKKG
ncbi:MAG: sugar phosphate nucleotidyltransferase, partial [Candidatus Woesearchaeota archaeon]|nr:sugar phosphate nucleotidyltransferase [Candidatus Woesearchaeota archaeon]